MIQITDPGKQTHNAFALFALGFRPFFLLASMSAVMLMVFWGTAYTKGWNIHPALASVLWHGHEMVFGYSAAVIAGFLLTAVRNWTGVQTISGAWLMALAVTWLVARILPFTTVPIIWFSVADLLFLPLLALAISIPLLRVRQARNFIFIGLILLLALCNLFFHLGHKMGFKYADVIGLRTGLGVVILIIVVMAGRVIGFFIERGVGDKVKQYPLAETVAVWATAGYVFGRFLLPVDYLSVVLAFALVAHIVRMKGWYHSDIWKMPLLWVLYLGYGWLTLGFLLLLVPGYGYISESVALHALTAGAIGMITMGMMARVALGHTGRLMQSHALVNAAFVLLNLSALARVAGPVFMPSLYPQWVIVSAAGWALSFLLFFLIYTPILTRPRVDGAPG